MQSARCLAAYLYSSAGLGESTTDLAWDGQALIYESGDLLAESERFVDGSHLISADVDLERVSRERMRQNSLRRLGRSSTRRGCGAFRTRRRSSCRCRRSCRSRCSARSSASPTCRPTRRRRDERCAEVYNIQVQALAAAAAARPASRSSSSASRAGSTRPTRCSSAPQAMDRLGLPRSEHPRLHDARLRHQRRARSTRRRQLMAAVRLHRAARSTSGRAACRCCKDIGHPFADGASRLRHHLRERAGRRAHQPPVPAGQLPRRRSSSAPAT